MTAVESRTARVGPGRSIPAFYRLLMGGQLTKARLFGLTMLAGVSVLLAWAARRADNPGEVGVNTVAEYGIGLLVPLAAVLFAVPMLGNLIEDRLLVYLWLKPVPKWHLAVAALAAVITVLFPVVVLPVGLSALIAAEGSLVGPAIIASAVGALAYGAVYLFLGARFTWGLWLALAYLALWENLLSRLSDGTARLSIRSYLVSIVGWGTDEEIALADRSESASIIVPLVIAVVATVLTARTLNKRDVD